MNTEGYSVFYDALYPDIPVNPLHRLLQWMVRRSTGDAHVHARLELSGLGKIFRHPIIDEEESISTWIENGTVLKVGKLHIGRSNMF